MKFDVNVDSKFRFVIVASKRAKHLLHGSLPKVKSKSKNLIRIAQEEVREGLVDYEIVQHKAECVPHIEDDMLIGEDLIEEIESLGEAGKKTKEKEVKAAPKKEKKQSKGKK